MVTNCDGTADRIFAVAIAVEMFTKKTYKKTIYYSTVLCHPDVLSFYIVDMCKSDNCPYVTHFAVRSATYKFHFVPENVRLFV